jgi:hypothetical protein
MAVILFSVIDVIAPARFCGRKTERLRLGAKGNDSELCDTKTIGKGKRIRHPVNCRILFALGASVQVVICRELSYHDPPILDNRLKAGTSTLPPATSISCRSGTSAHPISE